MPFKAEKLDYRLTQAENILRRYGFWLLGLTVATLIALPVFTSVNPVGALLGLWFATLKTVGIALGALVVVALATNLFKVWGFLGSIGGLWYATGVDPFTFLGTLLAKLLASAFSVFSLGIVTLVVIIALNWSTIKEIAREQAMEEAQGTLDDKVAELLRRARQQPNLLNLPAAARRKVLATYAKGITHIEEIKQAMVEKAELILDAEIARTTAA